MSNRLVYLYCSDGAADPGSIPKWSESTPTQNAFANHFPDEGFCYLFERLLDRKVFDEILVVIESNRSPGSRILPSGIRILVVPHVNELKPHMRTDDILWARGGWRSWFMFLQEWHDAGRWLLFYRAASNRGAWTFWDIVLDDLIEECSQDQYGRFYFPINKPIRPDLFFPTGERCTYDLMVGASHVHDKKGQYKILPILMEYREKYGVNLKCVLPGGLKRGVGTSAIHLLVERHKLDVLTPGMIPRQELHHLYCQSKLFVHCGGGGQNDRGPLEAMSCGTPVMLAMEQFHAPFMRARSNFFSFHIDPDDPALSASQIHQALTAITMNNKFHQLTYDTYHAKNGIDVIYPQFAALFEQILKTPHAKRQEWFDSLIKKQEVTCQP